MLAIEGTASMPPLIVTLPPKLFAELPSVKPPGPVLVSPDGPAMEPASMSIVPGLSTCTFPPPLLSAMERSVEGVASVPVYSRVPPPKARLVPAPSGLF